MIDTYTPKHSKKRKPSKIAGYARGIAHGYILPRHSRSSRKRRPFLRTMCWVITVLAIADVTLGSAYIYTLTPYAITAGDQTICIAASREAAEQAISDSYQKISGDDARVISARSNLKTKKESLSKRSEIDSDPASVIAAKAAEENTPVKTRINVSRYINEDSDPEVVYEADDTMLAGQSEVVSEGKSGGIEKEISEVIVDGKSESEVEVTSSTTSESEPKVIKKGTKGLPEGEDYETYEGYPVCQSGQDIADTASEYVGKVPYVYGGKDLKTGVDCSGFVMAVYALYGIDVSYPLEEEGISVPYSEAEPGDILCFPGHFGIYIGNGRMVHAPRPGKNVSYSSIGGWKIKDVRRIVTE